MPFHALIDAQGVHARHSRICLLAGPLAVKAAVLRAVELLGASGISRLYEGPINSTGRVCQRA